MSTIICKVDKTLTFMEHCVLEVVTVILVKDWVPKIGLSGSI